MLVKVKQNKTLLSWALLLVLALVWGSSFILIKKGLLAFSADEVGALRIVAASVFLLPVSFPVLHRLRRRHLLLLLTIGLLGSFVPAFLFAFAQTSLSSSVTGMLNALTPLFVLTTGTVFFRKAITFKNGLGLLTGFAGTLVLLLAGNGNAVGAINYHALLVVLATLCYGINLNMIKEYLSDLKPVVITSISLLLVGPMAAGYLLGFTAFSVKITQEAAWWPLTAIVLLGVVGTAVALILFNKLVQLQSAVFASLVTYLIPIVAVGWGIWDGEAVLFQHFIGMAAILAGVYVANRL